MYDVRRLDTFVNAKSLVAAALDQQRQPVLFVILVGTHTDCAPAERQVSSEEGRAAARFHEVHFLEISAMESVAPLVELSLRVRPLTAVGVFFFSS